MKIKLLQDNAGKIGFSLITETRKDIEVVGILDGIFGTRAAVTNERGALSFVVPVTERKA